MQNVQTYGRFKFHSVGQGLFYTGCIIDECIDFNFVYDCGGKKQYVDHEVDTYVENLGNKELDLVVLSHLHADHINGVKTLLESTKDPQNARTQVVMPYYNRTMRLIYKYEYRKIRGNDQSVLSFYDDPISAIKTFRNCEIILITSDPEKAARDAEEDGLVFKRVEHNYNDIPGVGENVFVLKYSSGSNENLIEYSSVYIAKELNVTLSPISWRYIISQPNFDYPKYDRFKKLCQQEGITEAKDILNNEKALNRIRYEKLCANDSCIVMKHWFPDLDQSITVLTGDLPDKENICSSICLGEGQRPLVYQIPHHGAEAIPSITNSVYNVVSFGTKNRYRHPNWSTLKQYLEAGSVVVVVNENYDFCLEFYRYGWIVNNTACYIVESL